MKKIYLTIPLILFVVDRSIKYFAPSIHLGGDLLKIGLYQNYSGAFSLPISGMIYNIAGIVFVFLFFVFFISAIRKKEFHKTLACGFIFFGGTSNIFDRLAYGYVIDYFDFFNYSFFNIADGMLILGIGGLLWLQFKKSKKLSQAEH